MGQLTEAINSQSQGNLPSKTEVNPTEHCKSVKLRSGKQLSGENVVDDEDDGEQKEVPNLTHEDQVKEKSKEEEKEFSSTSSCQKKEEALEGNPAILFQYIKHIIRGMSYATNRCRKYSEVDPESRRELQTHVKIRVGIG